MALSHDLCYTIADIRLLLEYHASYSSVLQYFNFVMSIVISLVGLVGNAVVICFLGFVMKKYKSKYWFLNLAIADFFFLLTLPFHAISSLKGTWTFGPHMCKVFTSSLFANMYSSIYILIALNIARVLSVAKPMFHLKFISQRVSLRICSLIWFITILLTIPVFYYSGELKIGEVTLCSYLGNKAFGSAESNNGYNVSGENSTRDIFFSGSYTKLSPFIEHCSRNSCCGGEGTHHLLEDFIFMSKWFVVPLLVIGYFIPLGLVIICNITIVVHVRNSKTVNPHRLYRVILRVILVYFIAWTPLVIVESMLFIASLNRNLLGMFKVLTFKTLVVNIAFINSCLNPFVYMLSGGEMRTRLHKKLHFIRRRDIYN